MSKLFSRMVYLINRICKLPPSTYREPLLFAGFENGANKATNIGRAHVGSEASEKLNKAVGEDMMKKAAILKEAAALMEAAEALKDAALAKEALAAHMLDETDEAQEQTDTGEEDIETPKEAVEHSANSQEDIPSENVENEFTERLPAGQIMRRENTQTMDSNMQNLNLSAKDRQDSAHKSIELSESETNSEEFQHAVENKTPRAEALDSYTEEDHVKAFERSVSYEISEAAKHSPNYLSLQEANEAENSVVEAFAESVIAAQKLSEIQINVEPRTVTIERKFDSHEANETEDKINETSSQPRETRFMTVCYQKKVYTVCAIDVDNYELYKGMLEQRLEAFDAELADPSRIFNFVATIEVSKPRMEPREEKMFERMFLIDLRHLGVHNIDFITNGSILARFNCSPFELDKVTQLLLKKNYQIMKIEHEFLAHEKIDLSYTELIAYYRYIRWLFSELEGLVHLYDNVNHVKVAKMAMSRGKINNRIEPTH